MRARKNLKNRLGVTVGSFAVAMLAASTLHAACTNCTFFGNDAGLNSTGTSESGFGFETLSTGDTGTGNTAVGFDALLFNKSGSSNTADGSAALLNNQTGTDNTAVGTGSLGSTVTASQNTAVGSGALGVEVRGGQNTAVGTNALVFEDGGSNNIAIGALAGSALTTGSSNDIEIGTAGIKGDTNTIRLGDPATQTATYVAGVYNNIVPIFQPTRVVVIDNKGHLGTSLIALPSSARFKRDIHDMGAAGDGLLKLRPVSFRYKQDPRASVQYGLIAEEVKQVYPELVAYGDDGKVIGVHYELLPPLMLGEMQKLARENQDLRARLAALQAQIKTLDEHQTQVDTLIERINVLENAVRAERPQRVAQLGN